MKITSIAAQLYTLRSRLRTRKNIEASLKRIKEIGYNAIQVSGMGPIAPEFLKSMIDEIGLKICATHTPYDRIIKDTDAVIREHTLWNCEYVGLGAMPIKYRTSRKGYETFAKEFSEIGRIYKQNGLGLVYHNHRFEFEKFNGKVGMEILFEESDPETFGFELDTYWVQAGGANPAEWIYKVKGRMGVVHFKDMAIKSNKQVFSEIGEGNLNWPTIIKACDETGVKWAAVEQDVCPSDPFKSLKISFENLKDLSKF